MKLFVVTCLMVTFGNTSTLSSRLAIAQTNSYFDSSVTNNNVFGESLLKPVWQDRLDTVALVSWDSSKQVNDFIAVLQQPTSETLSIADTTVSNVAPPTQTSTLAPTGDREDETAGATTKGLYVSPAELAGLETNAPQWARRIEFLPTLLSGSQERLGCVLGNIFRMEHDHVTLGLDDYSIGIQPVPPRPKLLYEFNEKFLEPGYLNQGIETRTGAVWRPSIWVFGEYRASFSYFDRDRSNDTVAEQVNRLDLFAQLNLTATERVLLGLRPLDKESSGSRQFTGYNFNNGRILDGLNARVQTLFFEGDFGEIFPWLDPYDSRGLDFGFSIGRMPLLAQQGLLINEDAIDALTITRNTLNGNGNLNLRITGVFSWRGINRNSATGRANDFDPGSKMFAFLTESDFAKRTVNMDVVYVDGDEAFGDMFAMGVSSIRRHHLYENTYNTSLHFLTSIAAGEKTDYSNQGELFFAQTSWTPHSTEDLIYFNSFWAVDQFTSPARGPNNGSALGQTGILMAGPDLGNYGAPLAVRTDDLVGASLGRQFFFDHTRSQIILEMGAAQETKGASRGTIASGLRVQKAMGQHLIGVLDGFVGKQAGARVSQGVRLELRTKF